MKDIKSYAIGLLTCGYLFGGIFDNVENPTGFVHNIFATLEFYMKLTYCLIGGLIVSVSINIYLWWKYIK